MRKSLKGDKAKIILLALLLMLVCAGLFGLKAWEHWEQSRETSYTEAPELEKVRVYYEDRWYTLRDDLECILLMGIDTFSDRLVNEERDTEFNGQQADFLLLMIIDNQDKSFRVLHINRDTMAEIERLGLGGVHLGTYTAQLCLAHSYGSGGNDSCRNQVKAVSRFLYDVPVAHYYSVTMDAIPVLNDLVGGVTVYIEDDFSNTDPTIVQGSRQKLMGKQALTFIRARGSMKDSSNINRMKRQQVYMEAFYEKLTEAVKNDESFARRLGLKTADYCISDLSIDQLQSLADRVKDYRYKGLETIQGKAVPGAVFMEFYTDEQALQDQVIRLFFEPDT